jgi:hypothetical protein
MTRGSYGWSASFTPKPGRAGEPGAVNLIPDAAMAGAAGDDVALMDTGSAVQAIKGLLGARPAPIRYAETSGSSKAGARAGVMTAFSAGDVVPAASIEWDAGTAEDLTDWMSKGARPSLALQSGPIGYELRLVPPPETGIRPATHPASLASAGADPRRDAVARLAKRLHAAYSAAGGEGFACGVCQFGGTQ